ncbi:hypothetical protein COEREDRAFT_85687 [Coemansia reversa NRRL 1564]|uniref:Uncharacterized protein n=1 Tax=Coemansia reversa (strain ATCC 12441 / NRRL 1564) TaxID=763665 RepID=A0A2G5BGF6_COERN|nr:hypothetical protein COEREDRAFT_85687 [Coemansia reversa NRRL 1564]|eukprot:PIA17787.1 hypothetical protein COEREDRAFT_85687 [Coemansia reversa NRRL 1564]
MTNRMQKQLWQGRPQSPLRSKFLLVSQQAHMVQPGIQPILRKLADWSLADGLHCQVQNVPPFCCKVAFCKSACLSRAGLLHPIQPHAPALISEPCKGAGGEATLTKERANTAKNTQLLLHKARGVRFMVSLSARLKRTSLPPLSHHSPHHPQGASLYHARLAGVLTASRDDGLGEAASGEGEALWHGAPVFDAGYWYEKGGMELVREKHKALAAEAEALVVVCISAEAEWQSECLALRWPGVRVVDIDYSGKATQPEQRALRWLQMVQDRAQFPQAHMYRLTARWAGCVEVFEHPLQHALDGGLAQRLKLVDHLPRVGGDQAVERRFHQYRALFLVGVKFAMNTMVRTDAGTRAMLAYLTLLLKTDVFAPAVLELADAQPEHLHVVLAAINANTQRLAYDRMRTSTGAAALQSSLRRLHLDMHNMVNGRQRIIFCAAHFPCLEALVLGHSPDFRLLHEDPMDLGVLFSLPWGYLVDLCLPFVSDQLARALMRKCPALRFLRVLPEPRYERWPAYAHGFSSDGLHALASQWPTLRQLVVRYAFRHTPPDPHSHASPSPSPSPSRLSFSGTRLGTLKGRVASGSSSAEPLSPTPNPHALPGSCLRDSFAICPKNVHLRVLRVPYLELSFATALLLLLDAPQLAVLEFSPVLDCTPPPPPRISATLRRRVSMSPAPAAQLNAPFADPDVVYRLGVSKHPLENMVVHRACSTRYITCSWIQIMNSLPQLATVTFVAASQEDAAVATRVKLFCARNDAAFAVEIDDQSRAYQTCLDFADSWGRASALASSR